AEWRKLLEETVPDARPFDLHARERAALLTRLLVVAEIRHDEQPLLGRDREACRAAESAEVADIGTRGDQQRVQSVGFEQCGQRRLSLGAPIGMGGRPRRGSGQGLRIPADSCRRRTPSRLRRQDRPAVSAAVPARARRCWTNGLRRTAREPQGARPAPRDWYA